MFAEVKFNETVAGPRLDEGPNYVGGMDITVGKTARCLHDKPRTIMFVNVKGCQAARWRPCHWYKPRTTMFGDVRLKKKKDHARCQTARWRLCHRYRPRTTMFVNVKGCQAARWRLCHRYKPRTTMFGDVRLKKKKDHARCQTARWRLCHQHKPRTTMFVDVKPKGRLCPYQLPEYNYVHWSLEDDATTRLENEHDSRDSTVATPPLVYPRSSIPSPNSAARVFPFPIRTPTRVSSLVVFNGKDPRQC